MDIKPDNKFRQNLFLVIAGVVLFACVMNFGKVLGFFGLLIGIFMPLIVGGAMAFIFNVPMSFFERQGDKLLRRSNSKILAKVKSPICILITLVVFALIIYFVGNVIFPNLVESIKSIADIVQRSYPGWIATLQEHGINTELFQKYFPEFTGTKIIDTLKSTGLQLLTTAGQAATSVFSMVTNLILGLFFAIYILASKKTLTVQAKKVAYAYLKKPWADEVCEVASMSYKTFANFLSGQCLEATILGTMFFVVLLIGGFPYAGTIAVIIGAMAIIPYIGAFVGLILGVLLIAVVSFNKMLWFILVFFVVQQIEGQVIYPKVVGNSVGLPALWTLLAAVVGGNMAGIIGMLVFIPLFSVLYALFRRNVYERLKKKKISIEM